MWTRAHTLVAKEEREARVLAPDAIEKGRMTPDPPVEGSKPDEGLSSPGEDFGADLNASFEDDDDASQGSTDAESQNLRRPFKKRQRCEEQVSEGEAGGGEVRGPKRRCDRRNGSG
jgi:hypothetical protein